MGIVAAAHEAPLLDLVDDVDLPLGVPRLRRDVHAVHGLNVVLAGSTATVAAAWLGHGRHGIVGAPPAATWRWTGKEAGMAASLTAPAVRARKVRDGAEPLVMVTAYDAPVEDAGALAAAGCFAIVLEGVPDEVARLVTGAVDVPTIGIGAGPHCDGQVLVFHDVLGLEDRIIPKFVRRYANLKAVGVAALTAFADDVRTRRFPADEESYHLSGDVAETLSLYGSGSKTA